MLHAHQRPGAEPLFLLRFHQTRHFQHGETTHGRCVKGLLADRHSSLFVEKAPVMERQGGVLNFPLAASAKFVDDFHQFILSSSSALLVLLVFLPLFY